MVCDLTQRKIKRLLFAVPPATKAVFTPVGQSTALDNLFEGVLNISGTDYPLLRLNLREGYTKRYVRSEGAGLEPQFNGFSFAPHAECYELTATTKGVKAEVFLILKRLADATRTSGYSGAPTLITCLDYCNPDVDDVESAIASQTEPFTTRQGELVIEEVGTYTGKPSGRMFLPNGFKFTFREARFA